MKVALAFTTVLTIVYAQSFSGSNQHFNNQSITHNYASANSENQVGARRENENASVSRVEKSAPSAYANYYNISSINISSGGTGGMVNLGTLINHYADRENKEINPVSKDAGKNQLRLEGELIRVVSSFFYLFLL